LPGARDQRRYLLQLKAKYGDLDVSEAQRLRQMEDENRRLKALVADLSLDKEALKAVIRKNGWSLPV
jgi:putative transposase